jgi:hypothetical protein
MCLSGVSPTSIQGKFGAKHKVSFIHETRLNISRLPMTSVASCGNNNILIKGQMTYIMFTAKAGSSDAAKAGMWMWVQIFSSRTP